MARQAYTAPRIDLSRFAYDPHTGIVSRVGGSKDGDPVGTLNHHGYLQTTVKGQYVVVHRLAWRLHTGEWPMERIDHENGKGDDNRWENMRLASNAENGMNRGKPNTNTSGFKGIQYDASQTWKKWKAVIVVNQKLAYLGSFETPEEAAWAYDKAARRLHGRFANINGIPFPGRKPRAKGRLGLEGVAEVHQKTRTVYRALASVGGDRQHIGYFVAPFDAALAYDDWIVANGHRDSKPINYPLIQLGRLCMDDDRQPRRA